MKQWYVIHTQPRSEEIALKNLEAQGFEVFLPRYNRVRRHARKTEVILSPLFPRYIFVALDVDAERWLTVNSTRGVAYIVRLQGRPTPVPEGIIDQLKNTRDAKEIVPLECLEIFKQGASVEILEGAFSGHKGIYEKMADDQRVQLLLNLLGRDVKISVSVHEVVAAA